MIFGYIYRIFISKRTIIYKIKHAFVRKNITVRRYISCDFEVQRPLVIYIEEKTRTFRSKAVQQIYCLQGQLSTCLMRH